MNNKYKKLLKNTSIFALGSFGSKILLFLIVPLYTYVLSTSDYGKIDLFTSTVSLLVPFTTLLIYEAAIRFLIGKEYDERIVFNNCIFIFLLGSIISLIVSPIILSLLGLSKYTLFFLLILMFTNYTTIFGQYLRAVGKNLSFSISGILTTLSTVILNLFFLLVMKLGINGYFLSLLLSRIITSVYLFFVSKTISNLDHRCIDKKSLKNMLKYSLPLVPNNIMWWIMNAGDKYVISYFLGDSSNGIFSLAYKIPTILTMVFSIFMQAWQVSAIEERKEKTRNQFYKQIFNAISFILVLFTALIILIIKPLFSLVIGSDFIDSWKYVPLLCIATLINCFATYAGVVYIINKDSKRSFQSTFLGAIVNLILNIVLIKYLDLYGVSIATVLGYLAVMIFRFRDSKKVLNISYFSNKMFINLTILLIDSISYIFLDNNIKYLISIVCLLLIILISRNDIKKIIFELKKIFNKNTKNKERKLENE